MCLFEVDVGATLTAREREIEEREEILREGMDLRTLEQAINNIRSRQTVDVFFEILKSLVNTLFILGIFYFNPCISIL